MIPRFLPAPLNMDAVLTEATIHQRRQALHRITKGLGLQDAYDKTLDRIRQQGGSRSRLGIEALMWISRSERPLGSQELCHALGVELGAEGFSIQNVPSIRTVLGYTLGLAIIDEQGSTPRLLYFTLKEYLEHATLFVTAHSMMAKICLSYLNCRSIRALPPSLAYVPETAPFLEYATCFWGAHAGRWVTEPVKSLALRLLDGYENHVFAAGLWRGRMIEKWWMAGDVQGITGLHCIAFWGITEIASIMVTTKGRQLNRRDTMNRTPLMWAVEYENRGMMELFLEQEDIEPDKVIQHGRTAFSLAAGLGNEDALNLLLQRGDVYPDSMDSNGRTLLSFAAERGLEDLVKLLLQRGDVDPNSPDSNGRTPLLYAVITRAAGVVKVLLGRPGVNPNLSADDGRTPLFSAAWRRYSDVVNLLLERGDINPDLPDRNGRTLRSFAAEWGREHLVKQLLERGDVNPDLRDISGQKPLSYAVLKGRESVVKLLSEYGAPNCESLELCDRVPICVADENASPKEAGHSPSATEPLTLGTADSPPPEAPISGSVLSEPPPEKALLLKRFSPFQSLSPLEPSILLPSLDPISLFAFFLRTLIQFIFLFLAFMICGYWDSLELFHAMHSAWK